MLDGLDEIDWAGLKHAYGSAADVPDLIRRLASSEASEVEAALYDAHGNIWHQGTVYSASGPAVPFLIEIARRPESVLRARLLDLLWSLGHGSSYRDVHRGFGMEEEPDFDEALAEELSWVETASRNVSAGFDLYAELLASDPEEEVRAQAARLVIAAGREPERREAALQALERCVHEEEAVGLRGLALDGLAALGADVKPFLEEALAGSDEELRFFAAVTAATRGDPGAEVWPILLGSLADRTGGALRAAVDALAGAPEELRAQALEACVGRIAEGVFASFDAESLLGLAFAGPQEDPTWEALSPGQQAVVDFLGREGWSTDEDGSVTILNWVSRALEAYGLEALGEARGRAAEPEDPGEESGAGWVRQLDL